MKNFKHFVVCVFIAGSAATLSAEAQAQGIPNFELYNKYNKDVALTISNVKVGNPGYFEKWDMQATSVKRGLRNQFQTTVDTSKSTLIQFWQRADVADGIYNHMIGSYEIKPTKRTVYLSFGLKDGKIQLYPQTGKSGKVLGTLGLKSVIKTESGLDNSNNVVQTQIITNKPYREEPL